MPFKYKQPYRHKFKPMKYKVTNWQDYNQALKDRGNITIWFDDTAIKRWYAYKNGKPGRHRIYSNTAIETAGIIRLVFHLAYRQTEGFMKSLTKLMGIDLNIPNYSTLSRRLHGLQVRLRSKNNRKGTHIIIDGSGLSVHGDDEFCTSNKGLKRVKGYRRLPIAINEYHEIIACELTTIHGNEKKQVPKLLRQITDHCNCIIADKNYDDRSVYAAIKKYRPTRFIRPVDRDQYHILIPPHINAKIFTRETKHYPLERSAHAKMIRAHGVINWQKKTGYGERSLVETAFSRYKKIIGRLMHSINMDNQKVEARLACKILNIMTGLGMPESERIG